MTISRRLVPLLMLAAGIVGVAVGMQAFAYFAGG